MNATDGADPSLFDAQPSKEQSSSLVTIILDTNPAAWNLLFDTLPLSRAVADLLVFINAHLACNYTNKVAVIASHCDKAQWLYPTPTAQRSYRQTESHGRSIPLDNEDNDGQSTPSKRQKRKDEEPIPESNGVVSESNKYRPFRLVEEEVLRNLQKLLTSTDPSSISSRSSTKIAGALTLALSYINRETTAHNEATTGAGHNVSDPASTGAVSSESAGNNALANPLQSRIMLITLSPSTDLAHQYIPIMNSIFACQRLNIPVDVLHLPLPLNTKAQYPSTGAPIPDATGAPDNTVFLQQAADATHGIFIPARLAAPSSSIQSKSKPPTGITDVRTSIASSALLGYLLTAFLPTPRTRSHMILPTRTDVDFRAACFCHRNVISIGYVCSICLSIFCAVPDDGECLTCGTKLSLGDYGRLPQVVPRKKKKKRRADGSGPGTPVPGGLPGSSTPTRTA